MQRRLAEESLKTGQIILVFCEYITSDHPKFYVIINVDPLVLMIINSGISNYIREKDYLKILQVKLSEHYEFLLKDSYVNCSKLIYCISKNDLIGQIIEKPDYYGVKGELIEQDKQEILETICNATTLDRIQKDLIFKGLSNEETETTT